ncbi:DOMON domain-containing protein [Puniceicoccus vermicola]|uniref:Carbohydrate-binding domain-containing protein n=1 Tax=Puniceicoccus vermicola TaxID=388746 RepID=A0A7X1AZD6_9BACT|nr:hypothetical protein [Puniceicoccus vermicola]MBC2602757.1 hypothetical protein [Puniceicoccus vermicola]
MRLKLRCYLVLALSLAIECRGDLLVYPDAETSLNPRIPVIEPDDEGASGKAFSVKVDFEYPLTPFLTFPDGGGLFLAIRDIQRRPAKKVLVLKDGDKSLAIHIEAASENRSLVLVSAIGDKLTRKVLSREAIGTDWREIELEWSSGKVECRFGEAAETVLSFPVGFSPTSLVVEANMVDELSLRGEGRFLLNWEEGYAAVVTPRDSCNYVSARLFGFDAFVVSSKQGRRDTPMIEILNGSQKAVSAEFQFQMSAEVSGERLSWTQSVDLAPHQSTWLPIEFPEPLGSDVYHLTVFTQGLTKPWKRTKHFIHTNLREEPASGSHFAIHDSNRNDFGAWPDALPIRISHLYARWGEIVGPVWLKDNDGEYGLDPETPSEEWNWPHLLERGAAQGLELYVSVESTPRQPWMRSRRYEEPGSMKEYNWGEMGGFPDLDKLADFAGILTAKYGENIRWYEVDNEPYYLHHCGKPPDDYVEIVRTVSESIKGEDPDATIVASVGVGTSHDEWTESVFENGVANWSDAISLHTYTTPRTPEQADLPERLEIIRERIEESGKGLSLVNSETGSYTALRETAEKAVSKQRLQQLIDQRATGFTVTNGWPPYAATETDSGISMVRNAVYNFAAGSRIFTFFGWNTSWPKPGWWKPNKYTGISGLPGFSIISADMQGERTPSQYTLALAVLSAQLEGILTGELSGSQLVEQSGISGAIFPKENGGEVAVLWSEMGRRTVLVSSPVPGLEIVSMLGQTQIDTALGTTTDYLHVLELGEEPVYLHSSEKGLSLIPSPILGTRQLYQKDETIEFEISLLNRSQEPWSSQIDFQLPGGWKIKDSARRFDIKARSRENLRFRSTFPTGIEPGSYTISSQIELPDGKSFAFPITLSLKHSSTIPMVPEGTDPAALGVTVPLEPFRINSADQAVIGRSPKMASLQEERYWNGPDELSALAWVAYTSTHLLVKVEVHDVNARQPVPWPSVFGSCVELFFDFRSNDERVLGGAYESGVYQIILKPALKDTESVEIWNASEKYGVLDDIQAIGGRDTDDRYWVGLSIPWSSAGGDAIFGRSFGFDIGVDGPGQLPGTRKTQLMLYGTAINNSDVTGFGNLVLGEAQND